MHIIRVLSGLSDHIFVTRYTISILFFVNNASHTFKRIE